MAIRPSRFVHVVYRTDSVGSRRCPLGGKTAFGAKVQYRDPAIAFHVGARPGRDLEEFPG